jgi:hypothetical protein
MIAAALQRTIASFQSTRGNTMTLSVRPSLVPSLRRAFCCVALAQVFSACTASKPAEYPISGAPVTLLVPKDLENAGTPLKGVELQSTDMPLERHGEIEDFVSVSPELTPGQLTVTSCRGERHTSGSTYKSCVFVDARVEAAEEADQWRIVITPIRRREEPVRNPLFIPIDLPAVDLSTWYAYMSHQSVSTHYKLESQYAPEALKANFDRLLKQLNEGHSDGALRQFKHVYAVDSETSAFTSVGAEFFPYHEGSLVELRVFAKLDGAEANAVDWTSHFKLAKDRLEKIARD